MQGQVQPIILNERQSGAGWKRGGPDASPLPGDPPGRQAYRRLEVKYCEGCGALGLRPAGSDQVYCVTCDRSIGGAARSRRARRNA